MANFLAGLDAVSFLGLAGAVFFAAGDSALTFFAGFFAVFAVLAGLDFLVLDSFLAISHTENG
ncbi:MAG: hypothetical protein ACO398_11740 [Kiritimatiellia bacterium]